MKEERKAGGRVKVKREEEMGARGAGREGIGARAGVRKRAGGYH